MGISDKLGKSTSSQQQTSSLSGYAPAMGGVNGLLDNIKGLIPSAGLSSKASGALDTIENNAASANPVSGDIMSGIRGLLSGGGATANDNAITGNLTDYRTALQPIASGSMIGNNEALKGQLDTLLSDTSKSINSQFAAAGRDGSPGNSAAVARAFAEGAAPIVAAQYNTDVGRMMDANAALYGAGNNTYGLLNQNNAARNSNILSGITGAPTALDSQNWGANAILGAENQRFAIPAGNYTGLLGAVSPVAQAFGTQTGTSNGTQTASPLQQILMATTAFKNLMPTRSISFGAGG